MNGSLVFAKRLNQIWDKKEGSNKTHQNYNNYTPVFIPEGFEFMSNSSPKRFLSSVRQSSYLGLLGPSEIGSPCSSFHTT